MKRAELYAVERGCTDALLDTFSFQARPFYEKLGYRVFGMLERFIPACRRRSLRLDIETARPIARGPTARG
jgi:hypothetical protein